MSPPRLIKHGRFLRGPIPLDWLAGASKLPGRALNVGIFVWHLAGMQDSLTVKLQMKKLKDFGVDRYAAYRAADALEAGGLITVQRRPGCCMTVTLVIPS